VYDGKTARAYPLAQLAKERVIHDFVDNKARVLLWHAPTHSAAAYRPTAIAPEGKTAKARAITLQFDSSKTASPFVDVESSSDWDVTGRAVAGNLKGWTLDWLDSAQVKWFAWAAEHPETTIYGK
jgi:hypothetical protein